MEKSSMNSKVAFITGAGSGIGEATARKFARESMRVCLVDLKGDRTQKVRDEIEKNGGDAMAIDVDVSDPERMADAYQQAVDRWGRIDVVFANAGINGKVTPIEDMSPEDWDTTIETNLRGTFLTVKYAIPFLKKQGGSIIVTSSVNGNRIFNNFGMSAYSSSKAAQAAFAKMAALELANYKIRVNAICPGAIKTNIGQNTDKTEELEKVEIPIEFPEGSQPLEDKPGEPEQVADLVYFLASDASSHVSGSQIYVDGAESLLR